MINAFSTSILPLLCKEKSKVHLVNPSDRFLTTISRHFDPRQVRSVRLNEDSVSSERDLSSFQIFDQLISLTILNPQYPVKSARIIRSFPTVRAVSLWFENEFRFAFLRDLPFLFYLPLTRLQIRCAGAASEQSPFDSRLKSGMTSTTITSFIFDSGHYPLSSDLSWSDNNHFLNSAASFLRLLINLRRVRFITNRRQIETFSRIDLWKQLIANCLQLNRVIIQLMDDGDFTARARDIEEQLRNIRPRVIFRIKSL